MVLDIAWWQVLAGVALDLVAGSARRLPGPLDLVPWLRRAFQVVLKRTSLSPPIQGILLLLVVLSLFSAGVALTVPWLNIYWVWNMLTLRELDLEGPNAARRLTEGVIAPLFWLALGGPVVMAACQALATLADSVEGDAGTPIRRLHRVVTYVPERLSVGFLQTGSILLPIDSRKLLYGLAGLMVVAVCGVIG